MTHIVVLYALIATLGTWSVTALGAATVIFFRKQNQGALNLMLGFAAGVMIAASSSPPLNVRRRPRSCRPMWW